MYVFVHTHFISDGVSLPEVTKSFKCSNMHWSCYFTQTLQSSDPVNDTKNAPTHKLIVEPKAVIAAPITLF